MGNPSIPPQQFKPQPMEPNKHNGILAYVPGDIIGSACDGFPPAGPGLERQVVTVQVPSHGAIAITYEAYNFKYRRTSSWRWRAVWASKVDGGQ